MKKYLCISLLLLAGCSDYPPHKNLVSHFKENLAEIDDIHIVELNQHNPLGAVFKHKKTYRSKKKEDAQRVFDAIFDGHYKELSRKGLQNWKYALAFHHLENGFRENKIRISNEGILYEGAFYPYEDNETKTTIFRVIESFLN